MSDEMTRYLRFGRALGSTLGSCCARWCATTMLADAPRRKDAARTA